MTEVTETQTAAATSEAATGETAKTDTVLTETAKAEAGKTEGETKAKAEEAKAAPAEYADFKLPDGVTPNAELLTEAKAVFKELGLTQEAAQKLIDFQVAKELAAMEKGANAFQGRIDSWAEAVKSDKELGGDAMPERLSVAKKALDAFASPELTKLLNRPTPENPDGLGLGDNPEMIRLFYRVGKALSEDKLVTSKAAAGGEKTAAEILYPTKEA